MKVLHNILIIGGFPLLLASCGSSNLSLEESQLESEYSSTTLTKISEEEKMVINTLMQSVPSPMEVSALMKESGAVFNKSILNETSKAGSYTSSYTKAMNLGIYGADLAYCNIYKENMAGLPYLGAVKNLASDLNIGNFFDNTTLMRLMKNNDSMDSLLTITTDNFEKINHHLQENNQSQIGALMLVGGWVEGIHLLLSVYNSNPHPAIKERIGEQKIVLEQLLHVLGYYTKDEDVNKIIQDMEAINKLYAQVEIKTIEGETEVVFEDGMMKIIDHSRTEVILSDNQLSDIENTVNTLRNKIIK